MTTAPPPGSGPEGPAEHLDSASWSPTAPTPSNSSRRGIAVAALAAVGVAAVGTGGWALVNFFSTGAQPAQALPASTLGYVSMDLDPNGAQKIEALKTLNKFEDFKELGLDADDDIRQTVFEDVLGCPATVYDEQIAPWIGDRLALAAVPSPEASEEPADAVLVLQVTDEDAARASIADVDCGGEGNETPGVSVADGWAIVADSQEVADRVAAAADSSTLADDADFQHWTGEAGSAGIVSMYVAPQAGSLLADEFASEAEQFAGSGEGGEVLTDGLDSLREFGGAAATVRFADGGVEVEFVGDSGGQLGGIAAGTTGSELVRSLPGDTGLAFGTSLEEGWAQKLLDRFGDDDMVEDMKSDAEQQMGITLPDDLEALLGQGFTLAVSGDADFGSVVNDGESVDGLPVGMKVASPSDTVQPILDKLVAQMPPDAVDAFQAQASGDDSVLALDEDYRSELAEEGDLGSQARFTGVVPDASDAGTVLYVDFDAPWLTDLLADEADAPDLAPLAALGLAGWVEGDVAHAKLRLTTD